MKFIDLNTKEQYNINIPAGRSGEIRDICPVCSNSRKKAKDKCLAINLIDKIAYCHHCYSKFIEFREFIPLKKYEKPKWNNKTELSDNVVKWFEKRKISQNTLKLMKITEGLEYMPQEEKKVNTIQFNYFINNELINIKYRDSKKNFKLFKNGELVFYNLDNIKDFNECIIVEGEIDCLSYIETGLINVVSVPNGANVKNLEYLDNYTNYFENKEKIFIATDNDIVGIELRNELLRRLGCNKCYEINFEDCKDANSFLVKYGKIRLEETIKNAKPFPVEGVFTVKDIEKDLDSLYEHGLQKGKILLISQFDDLISFQIPMIYTITGIPSHGKSEHLDFWIERLNILYKWKFAYFSPENRPLQWHASKLIEKITGKKFHKDNLNIDEYNECKEYMNNNFWFIKPEDNFEVDNILEKARMLVFSYGIKGFVIDPYNKLEHKIPNNTTETNYVSKFYDKLVNFAERNGVIIFLVAHPTKMKKTQLGIYEIPNLYDISQSANFYNKTDFGITIYRDYDKDKIVVYVQKVKFKHLGQVGNCEFKYNINNGRYSLYSDNIEYDNSNHLSMGVKREIEKIDLLKPISNDEMPF